MAKSLVIALAATSIAAAQNAGGGTKPCTPGDMGSANKTLSDKLNASNGVICPPPDLDPALKKPAPATGDTPVIPPPGSPGGNPSVQPK
jgi:hypothetical protein